MNIRLLSDEDKDKAVYLWIQAFEHGNRGEFEGNEEWAEIAATNSYTCGLFEGDNLEAAVLVWNYHIYLGETAIVPMGGIGGVACLPASRGKGYAGAGLRFALERMRESGHIVSTLFPFSWDYYRRFGWEWVGIRRCYNVPTRIMRPSPETEFVRALRPEDRAAVQETYAQFARRYRGMMVRTETNWSKIFDDRKNKFMYTYLYERDGSVEGYINFRGHDGDDTWIREFIAVTPRAQRGLLGLMKRHEMQIKKFSWRAPSDDLLWLTHEYQWETETKLEPSLQGRVVDVAGALQAFQPDAATQGTLLLAVQDECAPWNTGTWRVSFEAGAVSVESSSAAPQVSLDIQTLSQLWFGTPAAAQLRTAQRMQIHDEAGYTALQNMFAGPPMWINDSF